MEWGWLSILITCVDVAACACPKTGAHAAVCSLLCQKMSLDLQPAMLLIAAFTLFTATCAQRKLKKGINDEENECCADIYAVIACGAAPIHCFCISSIHRSL